MTPAHRLDRPNIPAPVALGLRIAMATRTPTEFHKWDLLQKEIQFDILDLNVMISHRIYLKLHKYYFDFTILPLLLFDRSILDHVKKRYYFRN